MAPHPRLISAAICLTALVACAICATQAQAVSWDRAWGKDVVVNGAPIGAETCTIAGECKGGDVGSAEGEFQTVNAVAADSQNVYVLETASNRVSVFDLDGGFVRMWGKGVNGGANFEVCTNACQPGQPGGGPGDMNDPRGIAVDGFGDIYVADFGNKRINRYDSSGGFVRSWGKDVGGAGINQCTALCTPGNSSTGPGDEFQGPNAVAVNQAGDSVYVADETAARVQMFDASGNFGFAIGKSVLTAGGGGGPERCTVAASCRLGVNGSLGGEVDSPTGVAADSSQLLVSEEGNQRVQRFSPDGIFTFAWGKNVSTQTNPDRCTVDTMCLAGISDPAGGAFNNAGAVAADFHGNAYVADTDASRIQKFDSSGAFQRLWGKGVAGGGVFEECTAAASCLTGDGGAAGGDMSSPAGVASDGNGSVFVADRINNRVQKFLDGAVPRPVIESIAPGRRGSDNAPRVVGQAQAGTTVSVFPSAFCTGTPVTGSAAGFASPGIAANVPDDSVTDFSASATNGVNTSPCSTSLSYTEDSTGPDTLIDSAPSGTITTTMPTFTFHASEHGTTFQCRFDGQPFVPCLGALGTHTPVLPLADGAHTFEVRALDDVGNPDPSPAAASFTVDTAVQKPQELPPPVQGRLVNAIPEKGTVLVKLPAGAGTAKASGFVPLETVGRQLPVGTTLDTKKGTVLLTAATNATGGTQKGHFSKGLFKLGQTKKNPLTTMSMTGGGLDACSKLPRGGSRKVAAARKKRRRTLFSNVKGRFRTRGRNSNATVRGTSWTMTDTCAGTITSVKTGSVTVRDFTLKKTRIVRAGHSYVARTPLVKKRRKR